VWRPQADLQVTPCEDRFTVIVSRRNLKNRCRTPSSTPSRSVALRTCTNAILGSSKCRIVWHPRISCATSMTSFYRLAIEQLARRIRTWFEHRAALCVARSSSMRIPRSAKARASRSLRGPRYRPPHQGAAEPASRVAQARLAFYWWRTMPASRGDRMSEDDGYHVTACSLAEALAHAAKRVWIAGTDYILGWRDDAVICGVARGLRFLKSDPDYRDTLCRERARMTSFAAREQADQG